jgi:transcriptional regulator with XRE-family HTH domain
MTLRTLRRRAGLTCRALARQSRLTREAINKIELGRVRDPRLSTLRALAGTLGVTLDVVADSIRAHRPSPGNRRRRRPEREIV